MLTEEKIRYLLKKRYDIHTLIGDEVQFTLTINVMIQNIELIIKVYKENNTIYY
jgi:hypothetical protein